MLFFGCIQVYLSVFDMASHVAESKIVCIKNNSISSVSYELQGSQLPQVREDIGYLGLVPVKLQGHDNLFKKKISFSGMSTEIKQPPLLGDSVPLDQLVDLKNTYLYTYVSHALELHGSYSPGRSCSLCDKSEKERDQHLVILCTPPGSLTGHVAGRPFRVRR